MPKRMIISMSVLTAAIVVWGCISIASEQQNETGPYDEDLFGPEELIQWNKPVAGAFFSHKVHTMEVGLDCASCHDEDFEMEAGTAAEEGDFTMAAMAEGKYCGACHYENGFAFSTETSCVSCHKQPEGMIIWTKPVEGVVFEHKLHTDEFGFDCASCHPHSFEMRAGAASEQDDFTMAAMDNENKYCGQCHYPGGFAYSGKKRCTSCHIGVKGVKRAKRGEEPHLQECDDNFVRF